MYVVPGWEKRTWFFLGLASYEGALRGAIRPGYIATYAQDDENPDPIVDRGAAPQAVREGLLHLVRAHALAGRPLPMIRAADGTSRVDWEAAFAVPAWARPRGDRKKLPSIAGGSDVEFNEGTDTSRPP